MSEGERKSDSSAAGAAPIAPVQATPTARSIALDLAATGMACNCDLDNWEPERSTGHSWVCRIHKTALSKSGA